ncbi:MAG: N-formylglutamate amidohydrolase [Alphaproteobacteria bacterium]
MRSSGLPDLDPVSVDRSDGAGAPVFICEHATNRLPEEFGDMGLSASDLESHIAWDPGAADLARYLSERFDAPLVTAGVSRLLYDCNRPPDHPGAVPARSEATDIPANTDLDAKSLAARADRIYHPFRNAAEDLINERLARRLNCAVITIHSFTPVYLGKVRPVEIGVLHDKDTRLADAMLTDRASDAGFRFERNQPYGPEDGVTHSLKIYGVERGLPNVMIEVRNDLLSDADRAQRVAIALEEKIRAALQAIGLGAPTKRASESAVPNG